METKTGCQGQWEETEAIKEREEQRMQVEHIIKILMNQMEKGVPVSSHNS